jgi:hypothetical protein
MFSSLRWGELGALRRCDTGLAARTVRVSRQLAEARGGGPRAGLGPAAYYLGGTIQAWRDGAGRCCMSRSPAVTIAGRGWMLPDACRRWLPVWLPGISLAPLTFMP